MSTNSRNALLYISIMVRETHPIIQQKKFTSRPTWNLLYLPAAGLFIPLRLTYFKLSEIPKNTGESNMSDRIGIVTGGGDCPGLNAVIRAVAKAAAKRGWETVGFLGGYEGILDPQKFMLLDYQHMGSLLTRGGTILGTANRGRFSAKVGHGELRRLPQELIDGVKSGLQKQNVRGLVSIGGDGSLSIGQQLFEGGVPLVGVPKTIDNDLEGTMMTFGFDSAVACATDALDRLHTTAESHNRVMVLEVMGRYAGWIAINAGIAGGADVILIPEIPFTYDSICAQIQHREQIGKQFTLIIVAEGAREAGGQFVTSADQPANREARLGGIGAVVAAEVERRTGKETRVCVLGHLQRGGSPTNFDRALCTVFGVEAVELIAAGRFGEMVAHLGTHVGSVKITEAIGRLKTVSPDGSFLRTARALDISLGD
jgi:ATP-dependent phosphofructokinase / diphosphate-dependent phosphofructokinase